MIHLLKEHTTSAQVKEMLQEYESMIKIVVDIRRRLLSGGGQMHSDCESVMLENGSEQDDLWGANWYPAEQRIEFESLINIRPRLGNRNILIQDEKIRQQVESVAREILGGLR
jgi:hypothetical protein